MEKNRHSSEQIIYHVKAIFPPDTDFEDLERRTAAYLKAHPDILLPTYGPRYRVRICSFFTACFSMVVSGVAGIFK